MKYLPILIFIIFNAFLYESMHAQNNKLPAYKRYNEQQKKEQQYIDADGKTYYIDSRGNPYYLDLKGNPYYLDNEGYGYYLDKNGNPYYIDNDGSSYYLDENGVEHYFNEKEQSSYRYKQYEPERFRLAVGGGYSFRMGERQTNSDPNINQALKDLMHGFNIDADIQYFFNENIGIGATTNYLQTSTSLYKTKQTFWYVGPSFISRNDIGTSFSFIWNIGLGALFFKESSNSDSDYKKTAFAMNTGISGEYKINKNLGIGLKLSATYGTIGSINYRGYSYDLNERQNISNFSITGFISFRSK